MTPRVLQVTGAYYPEISAAGLQIRDDYIQTLRRDHTTQRMFVNTETSHRLNIFTVSP